MPAAQPNKLDACRKLLKSLPAIKALRGELSRITPEDSHTWLDALYVLHNYPQGMRSSTLAEELRIDPSVASRKIKELVNEGMAKRLPDPTDNRASLLIITQEGSDWLSNILDTYAEHTHKLLSTWELTDIEKLSALLTKFRETITENSHQH